MLQESFRKEQGSTSLTACHPREQTDEKSNRPARSRFQHGSIVRVPKKNNKKKTDEEFLQQSNWVKIQHCDFPPLSGWVIKGYDDPTPFSALAIELTSKKDD